MIDKFERKNYFKDELSQTVQILYNEQKINKNKISLDFKLPENYYSEPFFNVSKNLKVKKGDNAIPFKEIDLNGNTFDLYKLKGKKILLVFSTINCGYCKMTAEQFSSSEFKLKNNVEVIYLKPLDSKESIKNFQNKFVFYFPILAQSKSIAELYGINGYPTFIEINENFIIEEIKLGYSREFINRFNQNE